MIETDIRAVGDDGSTLLSLELDLVYCCDHHVLSPQADQFILFVGLHLVHHGGLLALPDSDEIVGGAYSPFGLLEDFGGADVGVPLGDVVEAGEVGPDIGEGGGSEEAEGELDHLEILISIFADLSISYVVLMAFLMAAPHYINGAITQY